MTDEQRNAGGRSVNLNSTGVNASEFE